ncbi:MAG: methyltransferase [Nitrospirota bacterium]
MSVQSYQSEEGSKGWNPPEGVDPMEVMKIASAYWDSCVLHTANRLDIFNRLADGPKELSAIAEETESDERALETLLTACVSIGLLERDDNIFRNSPLSSTFLTYKSNFYQGGIVYMFENWYKSWGKLYQTVKSGKPSVQMHYEYTDEETKNYIMGMHNRALSQSGVLMNMVDLSGKKQIFDVAGGPGTFTIMYCLKHPDLQGIVFDLSQTLKITKEIIQQYNIGHRVSTREGDYRKDDFGSGNDAVLLSSMTNQEGPEGIKMLLKKSFDSMVSGGILMIQEQLLNVEKSGPRLPAMIGVNQVLHTTGGRSYSQSDMEELLRETGFIDIKSQIMPPPSPFTLITGVKP